MTSQPPSILAVDVTGAGGVPVVSLVGEMDFSSADQLVPAVNLVLSAGATGAVFNLSRLAFIDSTGVRKLVEAIASIRARGGAAAVACPTASVKRTFEILHLDEVVPVEDNLPEAIELVGTLIANGGAGEWLRR